MALICHEISLFSLTFLGAFYFVFMILEHFVLCFFVGVLG